MKSLMSLITLILMTVSAIPPGQSKAVETESENHPIATAVTLLESLGVPSDKLCHPTSNRYAPELPRCQGKFPLASLVRFLQDDNSSEAETDVWFYVFHAACALACVCTAALAAGLTMGLLSLDPLLLLIKMRAGSTALEQQQAASLLPIVKQHHLLLVTLLLLNSMANEALPLFLEVLVSPFVAVVLSVTFVLFFGEIIPSAVFTGPNKIGLAAKLTPVVRLVMFLLWPLAFPIAKLLDVCMHDGDDDIDSSSGWFNRGELSALIRIQYEERLAAKELRKKERKNFRKNPEHLGGLDFSPPPTLRAAEVRATKRELDRLQHANSSVAPETTRAEASIAGFLPEPTETNIRQTNERRSQSIHLDEVSMVEGALQMKTKMAMDIYTPLHRVFAVPYDMILNERNVVTIYSSGFSRVPVYEPDPKKPKSPTAIRGILMTKHLIVVNPNDKRPLATLPLSCPTCVSPKINLVDLLNLFQTGTLGHMALVCARPDVANRALAAKEHVPDTAGLMG